MDDKRNTSSLYSTTFWRLYFDLYFSQFFSLIVVPSSIILFITFFKMEGIYFNCSHTKPNKTKVFYLKNGGNCHLEFFDGRGDWRKALNKLLQEVKSKAFKFEIHSKQFFFKKLPYHLVRYIAAVTVVDLKNAQIGVVVVVLTEIF